MHAAGPVTAQHADALPKLYPLQQPMLSRQATDALAALCGSSSANLSARTLARLLTIVIESETAWETKDADALLSLMRLVETGCSR